MAQAEPELLSILQKAANPVTQLKLTIDIIGLFAAPQQWKITDEANPGIFGYNLQIFGKNFKAGKLQPRKLTQKQLKQQQQAKNKKGAKKQTKEEEKFVEDDPQAERLKLEWEKLSQEEKMYKTSEDPYKSFSYKFADHLNQSSLSSEEINKLENSVSQGEIQVTLVRKPEMSEEDLGKLKKSKPKNLNIGQLYPAIYKNKMNMKELASPGKTKISQRLKLEFVGQVPSDGIKIQSPNLYVFIDLQIDKPLLPLVEKIKPDLPELYPQFKKGLQKNHPSVEKLKLQIVRAVKAISQQYTHCFSKQKQHQDDKKHSNFGSISTLRMNQIAKKKDQFLNDFINNGKYSVLREKVSQIVKAICIDKFRKQKQKGKITKQVINPTLSQLNLYFQEIFEQTVNEFMTHQSHLIHEDLVLGHQNARHSRKQIVAPLINENQSQKELRLGSQCQLINKVGKAKNHYLNLLILKDQDENSLESYARFCLVHKNFDEAFVLYSKILAKSNDLKHKKAYAVLLTRRKRVQEATTLLSSMIEQQQSTINDKIIYNLLLCFIFERENDIKTSQKYLALAEKYFQIKLNPNIKLNPVKNPYQQPVPKIPKPARYVSQLSAEQTQQIRLNFISLLSQYFAYDLVQQYLPKISQCFKKQLLAIEVEVFKQNYDEAISILNRVIENNSKNIDLLFSKADICFKADKMFESQQTFLTILKMKPHGPHIFSTYLRLGYTYLNRKSWEDAKNILEKACDIKPNSSLGWAGLGIANLNLRNFQAAEQALNLSNIYDPLDKQSEQYIQYIKKLNKQQTTNKYKYINQT